MLDSLYTGSLFCTTCTPFLIKNRAVVSPSYTGDISINTLGCCWIRFTSRLYLFEGNIQKWQPANSVKRWTTKSKVAARRKLERTWNWIGQITSASCLKLNLAPFFDFSGVWLRFSKPARVFGGYWSEYLSISICSRDILPSCFLGGNASYCFCTSWIKK